MIMDSVNRSCASLLPRAAPPTAAVAAAAPMPSTLLWHLITFLPLIHDQIRTKGAVTVEAATHMLIALSSTAATPASPLQAWAAICTQIALCSSSTLAPQDGRIRGTQRSEVVPTQLLKPPPAVVV